MAGYIRLQELRELTASKAQRLEEAIDVGDFNRLVVRVQTSVVADKGSRLYIQHAAVLDEDAFEDLCPGFWLSETGSHCRTFHDPLRYVRWRVVVAGGAPQFVIDVVGRQV